MIRKYLIDMMEVVHSIAEENKGELLQLAGGSRFYHITRKKNTWHFYQETNTIWNEDKCLTDRDKDATFENYTIEQLNDALTEFYAEVRNTDGEYYAKSTLVGIRASINRHLRAQSFSKTKKTSKQNNRSNSSDVANDSVEGIDLNGIQNDLSEIKQSLQGTVTKTDLTNAMVNLVQQKDLKTLVSNIVQKLLDHFEEKITSKFECKIREATGKLDDKLDTLMIENEDLRERIRAKDRVIENLVEKVGENNNR
ncbi:unnamed protein product [Mytilus edulis]|uniref:Uncharacterized protein n=1 Tax=Mytilus edulis TaxID=6550 RepID=A0A8S3R1J3_MYTED|nr:unnamed protein product [Mytilus edulis]